MSGIGGPSKDYTAERRREPVATVAHDALSYAWDKATKPKNSEAVQRSGRDLRDSVLYATGKADSAIEKAKKFFR